MAVRKWVGDRAHGLMWDKPLYGAAIATGAWPDSLGNDRAAARPERHLRPWYRNGTGITLTFQE